MYFASENECGFDVADYQLEWLKNMLEADKKFILSMHVFPGLNYYYGQEQVFWHVNFTEKFLDHLLPHQDKIVFASGAHVHRAEFRDATSKLHPNLSVPLIVSPSVSPVYLNNPSYTTLTVGNNKEIESFAIHSL